MITAPFNFVPLSEKVFFPAWADEVSHDVPFEDGESGVIDITITAKSPIFIRDHADPERFCNHNGQYYIPGSSVKGMVRNVVEIISFSKMNPALVDDRTYAIRDLRNRDLYMSKMKPDKLFCGWLKQKKDGGYVIEDCGYPGRVRHEEIDRIFNIPFSIQFKAPFNKNGKFKNKPKFKTAKYKYELLQGKNLTMRFDYQKKDMNREVYVKGTQKEGTLVFTGQPSARKDKGKYDAKIYEFVFFEPKGEIALDKEVFENFKFAYFDQRKTEPKESEDWTYWKKKLSQGGKVPVFFQKKEKKVTHMGLSYLYKLPYSHSVHDGIPASHHDKRRDFAELLFGYTDKEDALKGRVGFSHFKAIDGIRELPARKEILGSPRASYYPTYIEQSGKRYRTYMDNDFILSGRKRYPIHQSNTPQITRDTGNSNVATTFRPLKEGVVFLGKLRYHNLKPCELGALLWALTFGRMSGVYHNLGMAKPLGYGKVSVSVDGVDISRYIDLFEEMIQKAIPHWSTREEITELLSMASERNGKDSILSYLEDVSLFGKAKNSTDFLRRYTKIQGVASIRYQSSKKRDPIANDPTEEAISKTKIRKAIAAYWDKNFGIFYHRNQIQEFLAGSFKTTPKEQQEIYIERMSDKEFRKLCHIVYQFEFGDLGEENKRKFYEALVGSTADPSTQPTSPAKSTEGTQTDSPKVVEYTMQQIAQAAGVSVDEVLHFAMNSTLPIPKKLDANSILKEAQAKGLINAIKKSRS